MRLGTLTLERYGPFETLHLPFDPAPGRLNLIVAPNGYGKSVIRTAISDLLFGIHARTPMDFRFGTMMIVGLLALFWPRAAFSRSRWASPCAFTTTPGSFGSIQNISLSVKPGGGLSMTA